MWKLNNGEIEIELSSPFEKCLFSSQQFSQGYFASQIRCSCYLPHWRCFVEVSNEPRICKSFIIKIIWKTSAVNTSLEVILSPLFNLKSFLTSQFLRNKLHVLQHCHILQSQMTQITRRKAMSDAQFPQVFLYFHNVKW